VARAGRATAGIAALGAALSLGAAPAAPAAELAADAGSLRAQVEAEPWGLELTDADGAGVLAEHPGTGVGSNGAHHRRAEVLEASFSGRSPTLVASKRGCR
jgi:hypothetical protein